MSISALTDPFLNKDEHCVAAVAKLLRSMAIHCWPIILDEYGPQLLRACTLCQSGFLFNALASLPPQASDSMTNLQSLVNLLSPPKMWTGYSKEQSEVLQAGK